MEALVLDGVVLQKALNDGRKLLLEKRDLEAQVNSLSDIMAEQENRIKMLEEQLKTSGKNTSFSEKGA